MYLLYWNWYVFYLVPKSTTKFVYFVRKIQQILVFTYRVVKNDRTFVHLRRHFTFERVFVSVFIEIFQNHIEKLNKSYVNKNSILFVLTLIRKKFANQKLIWFKCDGVHSTHNKTKNHSLSLFTVSADLRKIFFKRSPLNTLVFKDQNILRLKKPFQISKNRYKSYSLNYFRVYRLSWSKDIGNFICTIVRKNFCTIVWIKCVILNYTLNKRLWC